MPCRWAYTWPSSSPLIFVLAYGLIGCRTWSSSLQERVDYAVDAARRGEHELPDAAVASQLEQVLRAGDVDLLIAHRVGDRRADAGSRRHVNDDVDVVRQRVDHSCVADVALDEAPGRGSRCSAMLSEFDRAVVERVEVVENGDAIPIAQQGIDQVAADEAGASRDQRVRHFRMLHRVRGARDWANRSPNGVK